MNITIHRKDTQQGPFPVEQVKQLLKSGQLAPSDLGWSPGMAEWKALSSFPELYAKAEPLANWSLVLGIISVVGCLGCFFGGIVAGIPAVICGHIGRSKIRKNPALRGAGMALAGLICGYVALVSVAIIAVFATHAAITLQADITADRRNAQNLASVASAARAAGYAGKWASKEDAMQELIAGITFRVGDQEMAFKVSGLPPDTRAIAEYLRLEGGNLAYIPAP